MKNILVSTLLLMFFNSYSQNTVNPSITFELLANKEGTGKVKAEGSPYYNDKFLHSEILGIEGSSRARYNAEADQIEIEYKDEIFALPKDERYSSVKMINLHYVLHRYVNSNGQDTFGYLIEVFSKDKVALLKKDRIKLQKEKQNTNGYSGYTPPKYVKLSPEYYLQLKNSNIVEFPSNKKSFINLFKDKKAPIEDFLKANDLSFKNEKDMEMIVQFIATL